MLLHINNTWFSFYYFKVVLFFCYANTTSPAGEKPAEGAGTTEADKDEKDDEEDEKEDATEDKTNTATNGTT